MQTEDNLGDAPKSFKKPKMPKGEIETSFGRIAYIQTQGEGRPIIYIHHNSGSKEVFQNQLEELGEEYNIIALDLPGHGESSDAYNPEETYSFPGYAKAVIEFTEKLGLSKEQFVFGGFSLGGHVAIEILHQRPDLVAGILITGAPPIPLTPDGMTKGFKPSEAAEMMSQEELFTEVQAERFSTAGIDPVEVPFLVKAGIRTDGKARSYMIQSIK
jgi:pimeloyl-ACP methyl ester carboxylesterase